MGLLHSQLDVLDRLMADLRQERFTARDSIKPFLDEYCPPELVATTRFGAGSGVTHAPTSHSKLPSDPAQLACLLSVERVSRLCGVQCGAAAAATPARLARGTPRLSLSSRGTT
jgi:hypothetical protein